MDSRNISKDIKFKQEKSKVHFDLLRSYYILKKIFLNLKINKYFEIIKYNKKLQKRLNVNINNYKEYSQLYSNIEIEIKIENNKSCKFINILDKEEEYYHIYFDNSSKDIKRNYLNKDEKVKIIKIIIDYQVKSLKGLFKKCKSTSSIFFKKFYRNNITNMDSMFHDCESLKELDLSSFNTNNVTNMREMFSFCSSLEKLNLSNFNTNNVIDMGLMFFGCSSLKELP